MNLKVWTISLPRDALNKRVLAEAAGSPFYSSMYMNSPYSFDLRMNLEFVFATVKGL